MTTVAIIAEYNPFHSGHKYQIDKIREEFGSDTAVIAIMSGNYTQRGEIAFSDKLTRATMATEAGVNLVLELPFPYSSSAADIFARSAVHIASSINVVDYLSFGSECGDIILLTQAAEIMLSEEYNAQFAKLKENKDLGYAKLCEAAYRSVVDDQNTLSFTPNNILAVEYIKAIICSGGSLRPHTVKRIGGGYSDSVVNPDKEFQSATALRGAFISSKDTAYKYIPEPTHKILTEAEARGDAPCDMDALSAAVISNFRLLNSVSVCNIHDAEDGIYNRLQKYSFEAATISSLLELSATKKYTNARLRRAMWNIFFGVTSSDVKTPPLFTQVLAMDKTGMQKLRDIRKKSDFPVLTKPSDYESFTEVQRRQKDLSEKADSVFELTKPLPKSGKTAIKLTPYIKKG